MPSYGRYVAGKLTPHPIWMLSTDRGANTRHLSPATDSRLLSPATGVPSLSLSWVLRPASAGHPAPYSFPPAPALGCLTLCGYHFGSKSYRPASCFAACPSRSATRPPRMGGFPPPPGAVAPRSRRTAPSAHACLARCLRHLASSAPVRSVSQSLRPYSPSIDGRPDAAA